MKRATPIFHLLLLILLLSSCEKKYLQITPIVEIEQISSPTIENITSIDISGDEIFITTKTGLYKSIDWGFNWSEVTALSNVKCNKIVFINSDTAYVAGDKKIYSTYDGGLNWNENIIKGNVTDIDFIENLAFATTSDGIYSRIYKGYLGVWFEVFKAGPIRSLNSISVIDETHIFASGTENVYSTDGDSFDFLNGCSNCIDVVDTYFRKLESENSHDWEGYSLYRLDGKIKTYGNGDLFDDWKFKNRRIKFYRDTESGVIVGDKTVLKRESDGQWRYLYNKDGTTIPYDYADFIFLEEHLIIAVGSNGIISKIQL